MNLRYTLLVALFAATTTFAQTEFITVWETTSPGETITIPTATSGEVYNYTVDWGDGTPITTETTDATHPYATPGKYTVKITGNFPRIHFNDTGDRNKILEVSQWGTQAWTSMEAAFKGCENLNITATDTPDLTGVTTMSHMLTFAKLTTASKIGDWDVSTVTNMNSMFSNASNFNEDISRWDVSKVTDMGDMFSLADKFNQNISNWDVSSVTSMRWMFASTDAFNQDISRWKVHNVTDMYYMFGSAAAFNQDLSSWNVGNVTTMNNMFAGATSFNQDLSSWDIRKVTNMGEMFSGATAFDQDLSAWDIRNVTNMAFMFTGVTLSTAHYDSMLDSWSKKGVQNGVPFHGGNSKYCNLGEAGRTALQNNNSWTFTDGGKDTLANCPLDTFVTVWETTSLSESITIPTATSGEVYNYTVDWGDGMTSTNQTGNATHPYANPGQYTVKISGDFPRIYFNNTGDKDKILAVSQWSTQAWTSMENAFDGCSNLNITATDTPNLSNLTSLRFMFADTDLTTASKIGDWDVSGVTSMFGVFFRAVNFNQDLSRWDVSNVTNMRSMFYDIGAFNQDLSAWKVDNVTEMYAMFFGATAFNQDLSSWNVGNVTTMNNMFAGATSFNQDLSSWDIRKVTDMGYMFSGATAFDQDLSAWDISGVNAMSYMFEGVTLSTAHYESMLDSWSKKVVQNNVNFHGGNSKYCTLGETGKTALQNNNGWTFTDGGKDSTVNCATPGTFVTVWETTTANETITIPTASAYGYTYSYTVDWGDGMPNTTETGDATHSYATPGQHTVTISGDFPRIYFNNAYDIHKILEVAQWGAQAWISMEKAFDGCSKLNITAVDLPDLTSVTSLKHMFRFSSLSTANRIGNWDVSSVQDMEGMFESTAINADLSAWDTSSVIDMQWMFRLATAFNQDISTWDVGNVTNMSFMFQAATAFDQDLSAWDIRKVTYMVNMFSDVTLSTAHYDSMLDSWSKKVVLNNVLFDGGNSKYCNLGEAGRTVLLGKNWNITDGGKDSATVCATLSIENPQQNTWTLYPNPVESRIYISGSTAPQRIQVFGIDGKKHKDIQDANSLEVEQLKAGLYMVKLISEENTEVFKVIKR